MDHPECEEIFINTFIVKAKRERYLGFLKSKKNRKKFTSELSHFKDLDSSYIVHPYSSGNDISFDLISKFDPNKMCYVISKNSSFDAQEMALKEAIENLCESYVSPSIIVCDSQRLIIHQAEEVEGAAIYLKAKG